MHGVRRPLSPNGSLAAPLFRPSSRCRICRGNRHEVRSKASPAAWITSNSRNGAIGADEWAKTDPSGIVGPTPFDDNFAGASAIDTDSRFTAFVHHLTACRCGLRSEEPHDLWHAASISSHRQFDFWIGMLCRFWICLLYTSDAA